MNEIIINDYCVLLEITNNNNAFYEKGYRYMLEREKIGSKTMLLTSAEFNRLAMQAPLVHRMVEYINHPATCQCIRQQLLSDIAELEEK